MRTFISTALISLSVIAVGGEVGTAAETMTKSFPSPCILTKERPARGRMKRGLVAVALGLMLLSPVTYAANEKVWLKGLLIERDPEFQAALQRGIDATSGVQGAGGAFFPFAETDLNGDRVQELFVAFGSSYFSGSAGNFPVDIFARQPAGGWRSLGQVWGREKRALVLGPLILGKPSQGWATIRSGKHIYCWKDLAESEPPPETGYAGHVPQGGVYVYCSER